MKTVTASAIHILSNPDLAKQMGENGKKMVAEKFNWHKMADILEEEYLKTFKIELAMLEQKTGKITDYPERYGKCRDLFFRRNRQHFFIDGCQQSL